jgi:hypothetical protein
MRSKGIFGLAAGLLLAGAVGCTPNYDGPKYNTHESPQGPIRRGHYVSSLNVTPAYPPLEDFDGEISYGVRVGSDGKARSVRVMETKVTHPEHIGPRGFEYIEGRALNWAEDSLKDAKNRYPPYPDSTESDSTVVVRVQYYRDSDGKPVVEIIDPSK